MWKFRNLLDKKVTFDASITVFTGKNGAGKTNLLEAVSLLTPGRGLRQAATQEIGYHGATDWAVSALMDIDGEKVHYGTGLKENNSGQYRRIYMCQEDIVTPKNKWDYSFPLVWITPEMDHLFSANASQRRQFFDRLVTSIYPWFGREVNFYSRAMSQRNKLLQTRLQEDVWLDGLEKTMSKHSVSIAAARNEICDGLNYYGALSEDFPKVAIELHCPISQKLRHEPALQVEEWLRAQLRATRTGDSYRGRSSFGAHKSDFSLFYSKNRLPAARASTGQQKICLVGLLLAHAQLIESNGYHAPFLLLDEPLVHLDERHRYYLMQYLKGAKSSVFLTGTDAALFTPLGEDAQFFQVAQGVIEAA